MRPTLLSGHGATIAASALPRRIAVPRHTTSRGRTASTRPTSGQTRAAEGAEGRTPPDPARGTGATHPPHAHVVDPPRGGRAAARRVAREPGPAGHHLTFSEFQTAVAAGDVVEAKLLEGSHGIVGTLASGESYATNYPGESQDEIVKSLQQAGVETEADPQNGSPILLTLMQVVLPVALLAGVLLWVMNRSQGGGGRVMQFGRSQGASSSSKDQPKTTFADVAGRGRGDRGAGGGQGVPAAPVQVPGDGREDPARRPAVRTSRDGQDAARPRGRRRGRRAVLLDQRLGLRRDVRRRRRRARPRPLRAGEGRAPRRSCSSTRSTPSAASAARGSAAATTSASRR